MFKYKSFSGESESDHHLVYCSKFLLASLCHLLMCLEKLDFRYFATLEQYQQALNYTNALVHKTEMVFSSHLAYWSVLQLPVRQKYLRAICAIVLNWDIMRVFFYPSHPGPAHLLRRNQRRKQRLSWAAGCHGGLCSWAGSCCCPSAAFQLSSPCCMAFSTAKRSPSSGSCLWASPFLKASLFCSLSRFVK